MPKVVLKLNDDVSTDTIYPGRFMATVLPTETPKYIFADMQDLNKKANNGEIPAGSFIVAGNNFGCGSSREQAASTINGYGLVVIAKGFARIFLQNAVNLGLQCITCPGIKASEGDVLEISDGKILNITKGKKYTITPLPKAKQEVMDAGGLIPYTRKRLLEKLGV
jgi:3-isopropylmalate/(R)-2-methylmalate dehydratase small subunit